jgi:hypothetical protein
MTYDSSSAEPDQEWCCIELRQNGAAIVEKTRLAWITHPEKLPPPDAKIAAGIAFAARARDGRVIFVEAGELPQC